MTEDPSVCGLDEAEDEAHEWIEKGRKIAITVKPGKNKELKPQDKQTELAYRKRD